MSKTLYLEMCAITNSEPDPDKMPVEYADLMSDTQQAMHIVNILPDRWDGASGTYQGKDLNILPYLLELYEISNKIEVIGLITSIINETVTITNRKTKKKK
jgi:hypothetical protein